MATKSQTVISNQIIQTAKRACSLRNAGGKPFPSAYFDIQLKTLNQQINVFNMNIIRKIVPPNVSVTYADYIPNYFTITAILGEFSKTELHPVRFQPEIQLQEICNGLWPPHQLTIPWPGKLLSEKVTELFLSDQMPQGAILKKNPL